jgi:hypothetical protein
MPLRPSRPLLLAIAAVAALAVAIGVFAWRSSDAGGEATALLRRTLTGSHRVDSGRVAVDLMVLQHGGPSGNGPLTIHVAGPFERGGPGALPKLALALTGRRPGATLSYGLTSTGDRLFLRRGTSDYELPRSLVNLVLQSYDSTAARGGGKPLLSRLGVALHWFRDPRIVGDALTAGTPTKHITAGIDVGALVDDLNRLAERARSLSLPTPGLAGPITPSDRTQLVDAIKHASVDVFTGKGDTTLRRLELRFRLDIPPARRQPGGLSSVDVAFAVELSELNLPQRIGPPARARPISRLPGGLGGQ